MRPGFSTLSRIMEELGVDSPRLVASAQTTQWLHQPSQTSLLGHLGHHRQHLAQEALV